MDRGSLRLPPSSHSPFHGCEIESVPKINRAAARLNAQLFQFHYGIVCIECLGASDRIPSYCLIFLLKYKSALLFLDIHAIFVCCGYSIHSVNVRMPGLADDMSHHVFMYRFIWWFHRYTFNYNALREFDVFSIVIFFLCMNRVI